MHHVYSYDDEARAARVREMALAGAPAREAGRTAARLLRTLVIGNGNPKVAEGFVEKTGWTDSVEIKAAVPPLSLSSAPGLAQKPGIDFAQAVYARSIVGKLDQLRRVPFLETPVRQTGGATSYWVGEGLPKPLTLLAFEKLVPLQPLKVIALAAITKELARFSEAEDIVSSDLGRAAVAAMDKAFIDPANAGVANEKPAAITHTSNGAIVIPGTGAAAGSDAAAVKADVAAMMAAFRGDLSTAAFVIGADVAVTLSLMGQSIGQVAFDARGVGVAWGLPAVTSTAANGLIVLIDQQGVEFAGEEAARLDSSQQASVMMADTPTSPANMVNMWQTNSVLLLAEMACNWRTVRDASVVVITGAGVYQP